MAEKSPDRNSKTGAVSKRTPMQIFTDVLELEASMADEEERESIGDLILSRMAEAQNVEDLFAAQDVSLPSGKSLVDAELTIQSFTVRKGDPQYEENGCGYYYIIEAVNPNTGEPVKFATGALNILALLMNLRQAHKLPINVAIRGKATAKGTVLTMRMIGPRAVATETVKP